MRSPFMIDVGGRATRVRVAGEPANPPLILLHGIGRSLEDWSAVLPRLSARYRVLALDIPGFGFSERRPGPVSVASLALGVLETVDALGEHRPAHLIGNSLGGAIALQMQTLAPDRTASLILADSAGFGSQVAMILRLIGAPVVGRLLTARTTAFSARQSERATYADPRQVTRARIEHALAIAAQPGAGAMMHDTAHALTSLSGVRPEWRQTLLQSVAQHRRPTLAIWGERDRILPMNHLYSVRQHLPHAELCVIDGVGHMPQIEAPIQFLAKAEAFLAAVLDEAMT